MDPETATDRNGLEVLTYQQCLQLLGDHVIGRIAFVDAGSPVILPVNYVLAGQSVTFRSVAGSKLHAAGHHRPVAFQVDDHNPQQRSGWSVLVVGILERVDDGSEIDELDGLHLDSWVVDDYDAPWLRIRADTVTGRRVVADDATSGPDG